MEGIQFEFLKISNYFNLLKAAAIRILDKIFINKIMEEFENNISPIREDGIEIPSRRNKEYARSSAVENDNKSIDANWDFEANALIILASDASFSISEFTRLASPAFGEAGRDDVESLKLAILISVGCDDKREFDLAIRSSVDEMLLQGTSNARVSEICEMCRKYMDNNRPRRSSRAEE